MTEAAIAVGIAAQVVVWRLVARDRLPFWPATAMTFAVIGIASLLAGDPSCCRDTEVAVASGVGVMSGLILYGATRVVVDVAAQTPRSAEPSQASTDVRRRRLSSRPSLSRS